MHLGYYKSNFVSTSTILPVNFRAKCVLVLQRHLRQISEKLDFAPVLLLWLLNSRICVGMAVMFPITNLGIRILHMLH